MSLNSKETFLSRFRTDPLFRIASTVLNRLEQAGHEAFIVGGCVRDVLLQKAVHDIDIATSALPDDVATLFPKVVGTGWRYGTVSVIIDDIVIEVTTYRSEKNYRDGRRPEDIEFVTNIKEDLSRRDFTINAMACDRFGNVIDPFGGQEDLKLKTIRTVGTATERFREDALRMLRAVRIAAQLNFKIAGNTLIAIRQERTLAEKLAIERIKNECDQLLNSTKPSEGIRYLWSTSLIRHLQPFKQIAIPVIPNERILSTVDRETEHTLRWILFLSLAGATYQTVNDIINRFKMSRIEKNELLTLWEGAITGKFQQLSWRELKQKVFTVGMNRLTKTVRLATYFNELSENQPSHIIQRIYHADWELPVEHMNQLALNGAAIIRIANREPGPWIGDVQRFLLNKVITGEVINNPESLEREWRTNGPHAP